MVSWRASFDAIVGGVSEIRPRGAPRPFVLLPGARYEKVMEALGGRGYFVERPESLVPALEAANAGGGPALVHILIDQRAQRKPQQLDWHTGRR